jgi:hypothetical protein
VHWPVRVRLSEVAERVHWAELHLGVLAVFEVWLGSVVVA